MEKFNFICCWDVEKDKVFFFVFLMMIVKLEEEIFGLIC